MEPHEETMMDNPRVEERFDEYPNLASLNARWKPNMSFLEFYRSTRTFYTPEKKPVIKFFIPTGDPRYEFLSNFYPCKFTINGEEFKSVEHYY